MSVRESYLTSVSDQCRMDITHSFVMTVLNHCKDQIKQLSHEIKELLETQLEHKNQHHRSKQDVEVLTVNELANEFINRLPREKMLDRVASIYEEAKIRLRKHFSFQPHDVKITETTDDIPSALYHNGEFIFNSDLAIMNSDLCRIVVIHETVPGHHYMESFMKHFDLPIDTSFRAFIEGWALYAESFCDPSDRVIYLKSRMIRMCRAVGDIMINYLAQTKEEKEHAITKTEQLFEMYNKWLKVNIIKEINRIINEPGTVICYVIGEHYFFKLYKMFKTKNKQRLGSSTKRHFHDFVLSEGTVPFDVLFDKLEMTSS
jgi:uncharacterized protein (DUF885 family)